jgi:hypothetical protein
MDVVSVTGTELVVRIPDDLATDCAGGGGSFTVVLLESGLTADGGDFTLVGNSPTVLSVSPIIVQEADLGTAAADITISGLDFADTVLVTIGAYTAASADVDRVSPTLIEVEDLPTIDQLGVFFATSPCTVDCAFDPLCTAVVPVPGGRSTSTPISVGVTNFPGACTDTLAGAMVIEPTASVCTPTAPIITTSPTPLGGSFNYPDTAATTCSAPQNFTVLNSGGQDALFTSVATSAPAIFNILVDSCTGALVPYNQTCTISVEFCPPAIADYSAGLTISWVDGFGAPAAGDIALAGSGVP